MPSLVESLSHFVGRVEIFARGAEAERRAAEVALEKNKPLEARELARGILERIPNSPLGLALWADSAEAAWLDHEAEEALVELAKQVPWRADVWLRLGRARLRMGKEEEGREALSRAAQAPEEKASVRLALLQLSDLDLAAGDYARALRWVDRVRSSMTEVDTEVMLRKAECALGTGDLVQAKNLLEKLGPESPEQVDARKSLAWAKLAWASHLLLAAGAPSDEPPRSTPKGINPSQLKAEATSLAIRAALLDAPGATELITTIVAQTREKEELALLKDIARGLDVDDAPGFLAALAVAEGRPEEARRALEKSIQSGDERALPSLLRLAVETRDLSALETVFKARPALVDENLNVIRAASQKLSSGDAEGALAVLDQARGEAVLWADDLRRKAMKSFTEGAFARWPAILGELHRAANLLGSLETAGEIEDLAMEQKRPLRVAIVGEFNAGKSTFINALLGVDVAPTGVLPTTAQLHWVAFAPDSFARVVVRGAPDRVVPHAELKNALATIQAEKHHVERVHIYAPIERLRHMEVLDTPGFNAPDPDHARAARAAFDEAHVVMWLLDATHAMKASEKAVLDEVHGLGIPIMVLMNKADRLKPEELSVVMEHVTRSLDDAKLTDYRPVLTLSARLALKGRLGDEAALKDSHWSEVEERLETGIVQQADTLRERALRRKAKRLAARLDESAAKSESAEEGQREEARLFAEKLRRGDTRLGELDEAGQKALLEKLTFAVQTLEQDLGPLRQLSAEARREASIVDYVGDRFIARLGKPLLQELCKLAGLEETPALGDAVRGALTGASALISFDQSTDAASLGRVVRAVVRVVRRALGREIEKPLPESTGTITRRRIAALSSALSEP